MPPFRLPHRPPPGRLRWHPGWPPRLPGWPPCRLPRWLSRRLPRWLPGRPPLAASVAWLAALSAASLAASSAASLAAWSAASSALLVGCLAPLNPPLQCWRSKRAVPWCRPAAMPRIAWTGLRRQTPRLTRRLTVAAMRRPRQGCSTPILKRGDGGARAQSPRACDARRRRRWRSIGRCGSILVSMYGPCWPAPPTAEACPGSPPPAPRLVQAPCPARVCQVACWFACRLEPAQLRRWHGAQFAPPRHSLG